MHYLSPATFLGTNFQPPFDARVLQRERKRLLAELELTGGDALELNNRSFTKNDLINYFDQLQHDNIAAWHFEVAQDPVLLRFLQEAAIDEGAHFRDASIYRDADFTGWISPYFRSTFTDVVTTCFEHTDATSMRAMLDNQLLLTFEDQEQSWLFIAGILEKNIALLDHYRGRGQKTSPAMMPITRISAYIGHGYLEVIRQLPDSRFARHKDSYAFNMQHPAIAVFNRDVRNRSLAVIWLEEALTLAVSANIKAQIKAKLNEFNQLMRKRKSRRNWRVVWIIAAILGAINSLFDNSNRGEITTWPLAPRSLTYPIQSIPKIDTSVFPILLGHKKDSAHHHQPDSSKPR